MAVLELTSENFEPTVEASDVVIVDFWAPWCGPCRSFAPIYEKVAGKHADVVFAKVNTEEERELAGQFQIRSIPTLMVIRENVILLQQAGMLPEASLDELVQKAKDVDMDEVRKDIEAQAKAQAAS